MSRYTIEVRYICESSIGLSESKGSDSVDNIIDQAIPKIFDFAFPIFDENYRNVLLKKILKHYYTREIGAESVGLWKLWLNTRLNEVMPYYNKLYESELLEFNPLYTVDITRDHNKKDNTSKESVEGNEGKSVTETTENKTLDSTNDNTDTISSTQTDSSSGEQSQEKNGEIVESLNGSTTQDNTGTQSTKNTGTQTTDKTGTQTTDNTGTQTTNIDVTTDNAFSDTPQGSLSNVKELNYLTDFRNIIENNDSVRTDDLKAIRTDDLQGVRTDDLSEVRTDNLKQTLTQNDTNTTSYNGYVEHNSFSNGAKNTTESENTSNKTTHEDTTQNLTSENNTTSNKTSKDNIENLEDYLEHVKGYEGVSPSKLLQDFRASLLNIDVLVIRDLEDLFMGLW